MSSVGTRISTYNNDGQRQKMYKYINIMAALLLCVSLPFGASAHSGGLNSEGCHNNRKTGDYHCHRAPTTQTRSKRQPLNNSGSGVFPNCSAARRAGAAPVYRDDPGYGTHLDRDNDGIGCE
jgi:hypothetical protein